MTVSEKRAQSRWAHGLTDTVRFTVVRRFAFPTGAPDVLDRTLANITRRNARIRKRDSFIGRRSDAARQSTSR